MTVFESDITISQPVEKVYSFLSDLNNHKILMPDNIDNWVSSKDTAAFNIKNISKMNLEVASRTKNLEIIIIPVEKTLFNLQLKWNLASDDVGTTVTYTITAELNMMMKVLASAQLQKLADSETQNLLQAFA